MLNKDGLPLPMFFEASPEVLLLFSWWHARTTPQYAVTCVCCIIFGFISIALKALRRISDVRLAMMESRRKPTLLFGCFPVFHNAIRGCVAFLNYAWDYMLMLVAMTFNVGIFVSMLGGMALGFLTIGRFLDLPFEPTKASGGCECNETLSCGCHKGRPCTCAASQLVVSCRRSKMSCGEQPAPEQGGPCKSNTDTKSEFAGV